MDLKQECQKALSTGITIASLAKSINRDPSTLNKWLRSERELSEPIKEELKNRLRQIKDIWENINI